MSQYWKYFRLMNASHTRNAQNATLFRWRNLKPQSLTKESESKNL